MTSRITGRVAWIHSAPIKALAIQELQEVALELHGVENDRRFCIVDPDGKMLNAKRVQRFVAVRPHFDDAMRRLVLDMPDESREDGTVDLGRPISVSIYGRSVAARVVNGPWADALSALAGRPVRLVRLRGSRGGGGCARAGARWAAPSGGTLPPTPQRPRATPP